MSMRKTCASLCALPLLAACGVGSAGGEQSGSAGPVGSAGSVTVVRFCEKFAEEYLQREAIDYTGLSVRTEKQPDVMTWLSNAFQPPDSRFTSGYDCRFTARNGRGQAQTVSVSIFLTGTLEFAHHTKWERLQIIPVEHVVDDTHGRAGYGVFKYLEEP